MYFGVKLCGVSSLDVYSNDIPLSLICKPKSVSLILVYFVVALWQVVENHELLVLLPPFVVPEMNVIIVTPYVVVGVVPPLEFPHGLPPEH